MRSGAALRDRPVDQPWGVATPGNRVLSCGAESLAESRKRLGQRVAGGACGSLGFSTTGGGVTVVG
jgi:hypothetical protein